jgi:Protein NO VEIN, C-terminal
MTTMRAALARSKGQGFARTKEERKALEDHAMTAAKRHFRNEGFKVEDVSARRPYDLLCKRGSKELRVEVKGTTTDGEVVVLTNNEVKHASFPRNSCALFVLHSIRLKGHKAKGGK